MKKTKKHYYFDLKIITRFKQEFDYFRDEFYQTIDERVFEDKNFKNSTNEYMFDILLRTVLKSVLNYHSYRTDTYFDSINFSHEFTSVLNKSKYCITIEDNLLDTIVTNTFNIPWILLGNLRHDKNIITKEWKNSRTELVEENIKLKTQLSFNSAKQKNENKALLEKFKKAIPWEKAIISKKDIYTKLGMKRSTFDSQCSSHEFEWNKKERSFVDLKGIPI